VQHIQAVQRQQRLAAAQGQRAEQRRIFGFLHTSVPPALGSLLEPTNTGISLRTAGSRVAGCSTLAPKVAISAASSKAMTSMRFAAGATRGSVV
jgi:hypothetical protein